MGGPHVGSFMPNMQDENSNSVTSRNSLFGSIKQWSTFFSPLHWFTCDYHKLFTEFLSALESKTAFILWKVYNLRRIEALEDCAPMLCIQLHKQYQYVNPVARSKSVCLLNQWRSSKNRANLEYVRNLFWPLVLRGGHGVHRIQKGACSRQLSRWTGWDQKVQSTYYPFSICLGGLAWINW